LAPGDSPGVPEDVERGLERGPLELGVAPFAWTCAVQAKSYLEATLNASRKLCPGRIGTGPNI
jgi:hypothetical protein